MMQIMRLLPEHAAAYRTLMLKAYAQHPDAFTSSAAEREALPLSWWQARLAGAASAREVVLGGFADGELVAVAGLAFEARQRAAHKAGLFGMYVAPGGRGRGWGKALLLAALVEARTRPSVRLVQLTVTAGNVAAETLYRQCGFVEFGLEPFAVALDGGFVAKRHLWCALDATLTTDQKVPAALS